MKDGTVTYLAVNRITYGNAVIPFTKLSLPCLCIYITYIYICVIVTPFHMYIYKGDGDLEGKKKLAKIPREKKRIEEDGGGNWVIYLGSTFAESVYPPL